MKGGIYTTPTISTLLTAIGTVFTWVMTSIGQLAELFVTTPILQLGIALMVTGFVAGMLGRLVNIR